MTSMFRTGQAEGQAQKACIAELLESFRNLNDLSDAADNPAERCQGFLHTLESACDTLSVPSACREYRGAFTSNYKFLFPDSKRNYRFDVLQASMDPQNIIYVNGDKFEFRAETISRASSLQADWENLRYILKPDLLYRGRNAADKVKFAAEKVQSALTNLDETWAWFEEAYISELILCETKARSVIVRAVEQEQLLTKAEESNIDVAQRRRDFIETIAQLNSVANNRGKGRDDLDVSILEGALSQQNLCGPADKMNGNAADMLASGVIASFDAMRTYLHQVTEVLERVDPHLCHNVGLVERLMDWEESWEVGLKYVRHKPMLNAVRDLVAELEKVQEVAPTLKDMCDDCDVELFLCVPRIMWLRFLAEPNECAELFKDFLPHRFPSSEPQTTTCSDSPTHSSATVSSGSDALPAPCGENLGAESSVTLPVDDELKSLQDCYGRACQQILDTSPSQSSMVVWELLVRRAVVGTHGAEELYNELLPSSPKGDATKIIVEGLMVELERWSMELQRHSPEDWNQCSSLLIQCLLGGIDKPDMNPDEFHV